MAVSWQAGRQAKQAFTTHLLKLGEFYEEYAQKVREGKKETNSLGLLPSLRV